MKRNGFTLIELIMIIVILGILAAVAIPKFYDLRTDAQSAAEKGVVGGVRAGIHTWYAQYRAYPSQLDGETANTTASTNTPLFDDVLSQGGVTSGWTKVDSDTYRGPNNGLYDYDSSDGSFLEQ